MRKNKLITCEVCGKERLAISNLDNARYCSQECANIGRQGRKADRKFINCEHCGKQIEVYAKDNRKKFCSLECKHAAWSEYVKSPEFSQKIATGTYNYGTPRNAYKTGTCYLPRLDMTVKFRSSYEENIVNIFDKIDIISKLQYEDIVVEYINPVDGRVHHTVVDYHLTLSNNIEILAEVKPINYMTDPVVVAKFNAVREYCKANGYYFAVFNEEHIANIASVTTMLLKVTSAATITGSENESQRYSLNQLVTVGEKQKCLLRLLILG